MKIIGISAMVILSYTAASAEPIALVCNGNTHVFGTGNIPITASGALLDLEQKLFTAPVYGTYSIVRADETTVAFSGDNGKASTTGSIDRMSGKLNMSVMTTEERKKMSAGQPAKMVSVVEAQCAITKRLF
jgi:hypothetical protein